MGTYRYLNINLSSFILTSVGAIGATGIITLGIGLPWHMILVVAGVLLLYSIIHLGSVKITLLDDHFTMSIRDIKNRISLTSPYTVRRWWSYAHTEGVDPFDPQKSTRVRATANRYHVFLELTDQEGQKVCFHEVIVFDGRFPNEVSYQQFGAPNDIRKIKVQRTDRLFEYLRSMIPNEQMTEEVL